MSHTKALAPDCMRWVVERVASLARERLSPSVRILQQEDGTVHLDSHIRKTLNASLVGRRSQEMIVEHKSSGSWSASSQTLR
eukprot:5919663-Amphidinium_carterae.1